MSRDSGAGAYSHGMCCPSPRPQVFGAGVPRPTSADLGRISARDSSDAEVRFVAICGQTTPRRRKTLSICEQIVTRFAHARVAYSSTVKRARDQPELLDGPLDEESLAGNLRDLSRVNRWLGGAQLSERAIAPFGMKSSVLTILDV